MTAGLLVGRSRRTPLARDENPSRVTGLGWLLGAELLAGTLGFLATVHLARRLGPLGFGRLEFATAVAAWSLVVARSGIEQIVYREAARRPRLIGRFTELLLGLKCAGAALGFMLMLILAARVGPDRGGVVLMAGLILVPSALAADVAPRAEGRLGVLALALGLKAIGYAWAVWQLVSGPPDVLFAATCAVLGELLSTSLLYAVHIHGYGFTRPCYRRRIWIVLIRRGAVASLIRFGRVGLYGADLLVIGAWFATDEAGPYAAARRLVFALVALGLVVPSAVAPRIARAWAAGEAPARRVLSIWVQRLLLASLPASVGLMATADRWMPLLFGPSYRGGSLWLVLVAARLPWLLAASTAQAALVACRREMAAFRLVALMAVFALAVIPIGAAKGGLCGVAVALLVVEAVGALGGWFALRSLRIAPTGISRAVPVILANLALLAVCLCGQGLPLAAVVVVGAAVYGVTWFLGDRWICQRVDLADPMMAL
ncbi:MAG: oligosaccharide flippase family protein [Isosphaeraceae bacterium]